MIWVLTFYIMAATPTKRTFGQMQDDFMDAAPYANKLPTYDRSGNWTQDQHLQTYHSQLAIMISACHKNPDLVPVLYGKFAEAQKAMKQANGWHAAELFHPIPRHLNSVDDGFIMSFGVFSWFVLVSCFFTYPKVRNSFLGFKLWLERSFGVILGLFGLGIALTTNTSR